MLKRLIAVATAAGVLLTASAAFADNYRLRLAETWGPNFPIFGDTTKRCRTAG